MSTVCRSKNPATCRYHGTLENHVSQFEAARDTYLHLMKKVLVGDKVPEAVLQKAKEVTDEAQTSVDSHDENYKKLVERVEYLRSQENKAEEIWGYPTGRTLELHLLEKRILDADGVRSKKNLLDKGREKKGQEELPPLKQDTVAHLPIGAVLSSGTKILSVHRRVGLPATKREVYLEDVDGKKFSRIWWSTARIWYREPVQSPVETTEDPWSPR